MNFEISPADAERFENIFEFYTGLGGTGTPEEFFQDWFRDMLEISEDLIRIYNATTNRQ